MDKVVYLSEKHFTEQQYIEWMDLMDERIKVNLSDSNSTILLLDMHLRIKHWKAENKIGDQALLKIINRYKNEHPDKAKTIKDYLDLELHYINR